MSSVMLALLVKHLTGFGCRKYSKTQLTQWALYNNREESVKQLTDDICLLLLDTVVLYSSYDKELSDDMEICKEVWHTIFNYFLFYFQGSGSGGDSPAPSLTGEGTLHSFQNPFCI